MNRAQSFETVEGKKKSHSKLLIRILHASYVCGALYKSFWTVDSLKNCTVDLRNFPKFYFQCDLVLVRIKLVFWNCLMKMQIVKDMCLKMLKISIFFSWYRITLNVTQVNWNCSLNRCDGYHVCVKKNSNT